MTNPSKPDPRGLLLAAAIGLPGTVLLAGGLYGLLVPEAAEVLPVLGQPAVVWTLLGAGALIEAAATAMIIAQVRRSKS